MMTFRANGPKLKGAKFEFALSEWAIKRKKLNILKEVTLNVRHFAKYLDVDVTIPVSVVCKF